MSNSKAGKLLAKALHNSSREEAITAFGMAFTQAQREKISLASIHRIEVISDNGREKELVDKYNRVLAKAKALSAELVNAQDATLQLNKAMQELKGSVNQLTQERNALLKEVKALQDAQQTNTPREEKQTPGDQRNKIALLEQENNHLHNVLASRQAQHRKELASARDALAALNAAYTLTPAQVEQVRIERDRAIQRCNELAGIVASLREANG